jgi:hypothetical protein
MGLPIQFRNTHGTTSNSERIIGTSFPGCIGFIWYITGR